jgi:hypothetical protein
MMKETLFYSFNPQHKHTEQQQKKKNRRRRRKFYYNIKKDHPL